MTIKYGKQDDWIKELLRECFGGQSGAAAICNIHRSGVSKWRGRIPERHALQLYKYALANNIPTDLYIICPHMKPSAA